MAEKHVHGIFRVIPKLLNELDAVYIALAAFANQPLSLRFEVSQEIVFPHALMGKLEQVSAVVAQRWCGTRPHGPAGTKGAER